MLTVSMFYPGDRDQVIKQAAWIAELGGCKNHELLVVRDKRAAPVPELDQQFGKVHKEIVVTDPYSKWPNSCGLMFSTMARHVENLIQKPFLLLEPDAVPLKIGWLDTLEKEYLRSGRKVMGAFVPGVHGCPDHCSGVAVYDPNFVQYAGEIYFADDVPWDLICAAKILAVAHTTDLIQHRWGRSFQGENAINTDAGFKSLDEFRNAVTSECVLYHSDRNWTIPDLIRPLLFPPNGKPNSSDSSPSGISVSSYQPLPEPKEGTRNNGFIWQNGAWRAESFPGLTDVPATIPNESYLKPLADGNSQMGVKESSSNTNPLGATVEAAVGTQNLTRESLTQQTVEILKSLCTAPRYTSMVRKELKKQGVIK